MAIEQLIDTIIGKVVGPKGDPGDTPEITVTDITGGHRLTITVGEEEPIVFDVMDGSKGDKGDKGDTGDDGVSPTITITNITGGHRVTITDAEHPLGQSIDVMDGDITQDVLDAGLATKAPVIIDSASGAIASFSDGADGVPLKALTVNVEPVQDLHGYENPWPAGGGANRFNEVWESGSLNGNTGEPTPNTAWSRSANFIPVQAETQYYINVAGVSDTEYFYLFYYKSDNTYISPAIYVGANRIVTTPAECAYMKVEYKRPIADVVNYKAAINYPATVTTYSPYSNECPISGWTECNVTRTGVNVWDEDWELGYFDINGEPQPSPSHIRSKNYIPVISGGTYYFSKPNDVLYLCQYDKEKHFTERTAVELTGMVTMKPDTEYVRFNLASSYGATYNHDVSINYPSADTSYHPYQGNTYPISWQTEAGTVYGGTLDVTNGVLTVDRAMVDLGTLTWGTYSANTFATSGLVNNKSTTSGAISSQYTLTETMFAQMPNGTMRGTTSNMSMWVIKDENYSTAEEFKTAMDGVQLVYELATPIEITLSPQQIATLLGVNNIWADTGDVSVDYPCDTKLYIERINAPTDDDMTADTQIASGKYFLIGNTLYLSTTTIPAGDTINPGTNCVVTNLAEALNALNI